MTIRVGVIGVGSMGRNHARVYRDLPEVELVGVADPQREALEQVAGRYGGQPFEDPIQLMEEGDLDAASVTVPTRDHLEIALALIERGVPILIEKPIAFTVEEGRQIIEAAAQGNVGLMVGHIERFNPAIVDLKKRLEAGELGRVYQVEARREGPFPDRIKDVGVVIDLAVHDLDVMRHITGSEVLRVYAETERRIHSRHEDLLTGLVRLEDGVVGTLSVNWLTPTKVRELTVTGEKGMFKVDYLTQDLYFFENAVAREPEWETLQVLRGVSEGPMVRHVVRKREPLRVELEAFLQMVREGGPSPVTGEDGLRALELARAIVESGQSHQVVEVSDE